MNEEEIVTDTKTSLLVETLEQRWKTYRSELKRCQKEPSEEAIHDLRVATRRLLALMDMLRVISPHPRLQKLRRIFKSQLDSLDDLRDTQVMLVEVSDSIGNLPELAPFQEYLSKREKRLLKSTAKAIKTFKISNIRQRLDSTRKTLLKLDTKSGPQLSLLQIVDDAYEAAMRRFRRIEPTQAATIHRARIAFKKFRYTLEIVHSLATNLPEKNLKQMHEYQGLMGDIQDLEVILSIFDEFVEKDASYNPQPVRRFYQQRHTDAINAYLEGMQQIDIFWRPSPDSPFPWEEKQSQEDPTESLSGHEEILKGEQDEAEKESEK